MLKIQLLHSITVCPIQINHHSRTQKNPNNYRRHDKLNRIQLSSFFGLFTDCSPIQTNIETDFWNRYRESSTFMTRDGTAEPVSRDQILRREQRGQGNIHFPCSADHVQDWQPDSVDPYSCYCIGVTIHDKQNVYHRIILCQIAPLVSTDDGVARKKSGPIAYRATCGRLA